VVYIPLAALQNFPPEVVAVRFECEVLGCWSISQSVGRPATEIATGATRRACKMQTCCFFRWRTRGIQTSTTCCTRTGRTSGCVWPRRACSGSTTWTIPSPQACQQVPPPPLPRGVSHIPHERRASERISECQKHFDLLARLALALIWLPPPAGRSPYDPNEVGWEAVGGRG